MVIQSRDGGRTQCRLVALSALPSELYMGSRRGKGVGVAVQSLGIRDPISTVGYRKGT